jgi:excinuclease ABC subunit C
MRDSAGTVLYVGKAKNLRRRLSSHFGTIPRPRWLATTADIELILVHNETEALILEHNLIKLHRPRANRKLLDADEGYFFIALTDEELPRPVAYRKHRINKALERGGVVTPVARCFGPYVNRGFRDALLSYVADQFRLRTCAPLPSEVCLRYHLGVCSGICERRVSTKTYARAVADAVAFLSRRHADVIRQMKRQMVESAAELHFERASWIKRHVEQLAGALEPQVVERHVRHDQDVLHFESNSVLALHIRRGVVCGCTVHVRTGASGDEFVLAHYARECPGELIVNEVEDPRSLEQRLAASTGQRVRVTCASSGRGAAHRLMKLCALNHAHRVAQPPRVVSPVRPTPVLR